jgi:integrase
LSEGVELDVLRANPAARLRLEAPPRPEMTVLTRPEIRALAEATSRPTDRLAIYVAAYTGLRAGELWALRRSDIDLENHRIIVRRTLTSESGELLFRNEMKTAASRRVVSLPRRLTNMIATHLASVPRDPDALVFTAPGGANGRREGEGGPVRHELFRRRVFKPAVKAAVTNGSLPAAKGKLRWHDLRHTCASILISEGASIKLVQTRLGHSSATTTLDRYSWVFPSEEAALADALDAAFEDSFEDGTNVVPLKPSPSTAESDAATG